MEKIRSGKFRVYFLYYVYIYFLDYVYDINKIGNTCIFLSHVLIITIVVVYKYMIY